MITAGFKEIGGPGLELEKRVRAAAKVCILRLSAMVSNHPEIAELDINPLIVYPEGQGCVVADARMYFPVRKCPERNDN